MVLELLYIKGNGMENRHQLPDLGTGILDSGEKVAKNKGNGEWSWYPVMGGDPRHTVREPGCCPQWNGAMEIKTCGILSDGEAFACPKA